MSLKSELAEFENKLNSAINSVLQTDVLDDFKPHMQKAVSEQVYEAYHSNAKEPYQRRGYDRYGLQDERVIEITSFDPVKHIVEISNTAQGVDSRYIVPIIESGEGYTWKNSEIYKMQPYPRPFIKIAEREFYESKAFENALLRGLRLRGF